MVKSADDTTPSTDDKKQEYRRAYSERIRKDNERVARMIANAIRSNPIVAMAVQQALLTPDDMFTSITLRKASWYERAMQMLREEEKEAGL